MLVFLALTYFGLSCFDAWLTRRRIKHYGIDVELNGFTRFMSKFGGPEYGVLISVIGPSAGLVAIMLYLNWPLALAFLIGMRTKMFFYQVQSLKFEKQLTDFKNSLGSSEKSPPSTPSPDCDPKTPKFPEDDACG